MLKIEEISGGGIDGIVSVKQYRYRTARIQDELYSTSRDDAKEVERYLALKARASVDNHTVYEVERRDGTFLYLSFSDGFCRVGKSIIQERW